MSTPNPLLPQGSFQALAAKGASNVRLAVATIVAIHVVFFGGLLLQGCKRDNSTSATGDTNTNTMADLSLPAIDSNSLYYPSSNSLPADTAASQDANAAAGAVHQPAQSWPAPASSTTAENMWQATNIASPVANGTGVGAADASAGPSKEYTVASGDSFGRIAQRNKTTVSALKRANPGVDPLKIRPGQKINVPAATAATTPSSNGNSLLTGTGVGTASASGAANSYTVKAGDTLTKIATRNGVTVSQLRAANNMKTSRVNIGQKLKIPARSQASNGATSNPTPTPPTF